MALSSILNVVFPSLCLNCHTEVESGKIICEKCLGGIPLNQTLFCSVCHARLPDNKKTCHKNAKFVLGSATNYDNDAVKNLIHGLKFKSLHAAAKPLADLLIQYFSNLRLPRLASQAKRATPNFIVVPVPLSGERLRKRGFNQSELIAEMFAKRFALPIDKNSLARTKNTKPQSDTKGLKERKENVGGCFSVKNPEAACDRNIILVDDVITSGATVSEAVSALKTAGAKKILVLTVAKA